MFKFFRRKKHKPSEMYGAWQQIGHAVEKRQRQAADYLNGKAEPLTSRQVMAGFSCFALLFGCSAAYVTWEAFHGPPGVVRVQSVKASEHILPPDTKSGETGMLTKEERQNIRAFRHHLDSLQQTATGKRIYDSIARHRPGLLDSLAFIEHVYQQPLKTSEDGKKK